MQYVWCRGKIQFSLQSHLYGIEMTLALLHLLWFLNSNRTFMELKFEMITKALTNKDTPIAPLWNWNKSIEMNILDLGQLQSHLYGIEIVPTSAIVRVSFKTPIAPLWNWNEGRNQYIILVCKTPIAPLWNWNTVMSANSCVVPLLQSHLYGIEIF